MKNFGSTPWIKTIAQDDVYWSSVSLSSSGQYQTAVMNQNNGYIATSSNYGKTWNSGPNYPYVTSVSVSSSGQYQTICLSNSGSGGIYISSNYGQNWTKTSALILNWTSVSISSSGQYQTGVVYGGGIYISYNYGVTWTITSAPSNVNWTSVSLSSSGQYQTGVVYGGGIYISYNYGVTWTITSAPSNVNWNSVSLSSSGQYQSATVNNGQIYVSTNFGNNWTAKDTNRAWRSISLSSSGQYQTSVVWSIGIYSSSDYGNNWYQTSSLTYDWLSVSLSSSGQYQSAVIYSLTSATGGIYTSNILNTFGGIGSTGTSAGNTLTYNTTSGQISYNTSKSFVIDHPINHNKYLVHACLEGPEAGVYYRGKGTIENNDYVKVILPDYVSTLASDFTIQLTPIYDGNRNKSAYFASEVVNNSFDVYGDNGDFYWTVHAKRNDIVVEPNKDNVILKGHGPYLWI